MPSLHIPHPLSSVSVVVISQRYALIFFWNEVTKLVQFPQVGVLVRCTTCNYYSIIKLTMLTQRPSYSQGSMVEMSMGVNSGGIAEVVANQIIPSG